MLLPDAQLKIRGQSIEIGPIGLAGEKGADQDGFTLAGYLDHFEVNDAAVKALSMSADVFGLSADQRVQLAAVSPRLRLERVQWQLKPARVRESFTVLADVANLELSLAGVVPGLSGLSGFVQFGFGAGYFDFDATNAQVQFGSLYDVPWSIAAIQGRLAYRQAEDGFALTSGKLVARAYESHAGSTIANLGIGSEREGLRFECRFAVFAEYRSRNRDAMAERKPASGSFIDHGTFCSWLARSN